MGARSCRQHCNHRLKEHWSKRDKTKIGIFLFLLRGKQNDNKKVWVASNRIELKKMSKERKRKRNDYFSKTISLIRNSGFMSSMNYWWVTVVFHFSWDQSINMLLLSGFIFNLLTANSQHVTQFMGYWIYSQKIKIITNDRFIGKNTTIPNMKCRSDIVLSYLQNYKFNYTPTLLSNQFIVFLTNLLYSIMTN